MKTITCAVLLCIAPVSLMAQEAWTSVTYLSGTAVYIDAGTKDGLKEGSRLEVVRGGEPIADLVVAFVSSSRASCTVERSSAAPAVGDSVRYTPIRPTSAVQSEAVASGGAGTATSGRSRSSRPAGYLRGRFGVRYLVVDPGAGAGGTLTQPAFDLRIDGQRLGNTPLGVVVDVRAQRSSYTAAGATSPAPLATNVTRAYQAAVIWNPIASPARLTLGRQFATSLSTIGMFDGAAFDLDGARWSAGVLAGTQPEPMALGLSGDVKQYGGYVQAHNRPSAASLWSFTLGGVGAYDRGQIDREFAYVRATYTGRHLSLFAAQELDVNRGWRIGAEGSATTPTSTFAIANLAVTDWFGVNAGVDNRRSVRLYRDFVNAESIFDDAFRQGVWGGASLVLFSRMRLATDVRTSAGGSAGTAQSTTNSVSIARITPFQIGLRARDTRFTGQLTAGQLQSASVEVTPFGAMRIEYTIGRRDSAHPLDTSTQTHLTWTGLDADVGIGRSVYLLLSTSRESGTVDHNLQSYAALSFRF